MDAGALKPPRLTFADLNEEGGATATIEARQQMRMIALSIVTRQSAGLVAMFR